MAADLRKQAAQFRLENDDKREHDDGGKGSQQPGNDTEPEELGKMCKAQHKHGETREHAQSARSAEAEVSVINTNGEDEDFEGTLPIVGGKLLERGEHHPAMIASVIRSASTLGFTSCTRKTRAPRSRQ